MAKITYEQFLKYYDRNVLSHHKSNSHIYNIEEEDYGGCIYHKGSNWYRIRFAYRTLSNEVIVVAAWLPDLIKISEEENRIWTGFELNGLEFKSPDPPFDDWVGTFFSPGGKFPETPIRPIANIYRLLDLINAITIKCCKSQFFKKGRNPSLQYPDAPNTKSYTHSIQELNNLINDEMNIETIQALSSYLDKPISKPNLKLNSLKEIIPNDKIEVIHEPLRVCSRKRQRIHGISSEGPQEYDAFNIFKSDLVNIGNALLELLIWLEEIYSVDAKSCLRRVEMEKYLPELEEKDTLEHILEILKQAEGKKIEKVDFGKQKSYSNSHESEGANIHFNDGTTLFIRIGSNSQDVSQNHDNLNPSDFHATLEFNWAPSIKKK